MTFFEVTKISLRPFQLLFNRWINFTNKLNLRFQLRSTMSVFSFSISNFSKVANTLSGRMAILLEDKCLFRKKLPEKILRNKSNPWVYPAGNIIKKHVKSAALIRSPKMSVFSYSISNFSKVKNILSGREAMLLEDKSLLREEKLQNEIAFKQIFKINLSGRNVIG